MRNKKDTKVFDLCVFAGSLAIMGYFAWHGFYGPRSLDHARAIRREVATYQDKLDKITSKRKARQARVALLRPGSIDPDMLDETARSVLGFARKEDLIVFSDLN